MKSLTPEQMEVANRASELRERIDERIRTCNYESRPWHNEDSQYPNSVYVGRVQVSDVRYAYYVGQSKRPIRRWQSHLVSGTGCVPFGDDPVWAVLAWDIPDATLDVAESYLIGYFLARFGCVNGNRGKCEHAFQTGYLDGMEGRPSQICGEIDVQKLLWRCVGNFDDNPKWVDRPEGDTRLWDCRWGFHLVAHDVDRVIAAKIVPLEERLSKRELELSQREERQKSIPREMFTWGMVLGVLIGIVLGIVASR